MPHVPLQFRTKPGELAHKSQIAPATSAAMGIASDPLTSQGLPSAKILGTKPKPVVRKQASPKRRSLKTISMQDRLSISGWEVDPYQIADDLSGNPF
jgi:hypothetical protein